MMNTEKYRAGNFQTLTDEIEAQRRQIEPEDHKVRAADVRVKPGDKGLILTSPLSKAVPAPLTLQSRAWEQLLRVLGADPGTLKMLSPELQAKTTTQLLEKHRALPLVLRSVQSDQVRAVFTGRHQVQDNLQLVRWLSGLASRWPRAELSYRLNDETLEILLVFQQGEGEVAVGDVVRVGVSVMTSEVGAVTPSASGAVWRLICSNLAVTCEMWRSRGRDLGDLSVVVPKIHSQVSGLLDSAGAGRQSMQELAHLELLDREAAVAAFAGKIRMSKVARQRLAVSFVQQRQQLLPNGRQERLPPTGLGLWNAATGAARELGVKDSRPLEVAAGRLLQEPFRKKFTTAYNQRVASRR